MRKCLCLLGVMLLLAVSVHGAETKTHNCITSQFNYSIEYPSNWRVEDMFGIVAVSPLEDPFEGTFVSIAVADMSKTKKNFKEFNAMLFDKIIPQELSNFKILDKGSILLDGKEGLFQVYTGDKGGIGLKYKRYVFKKGNGFYELTFQSLEDNFKKYLTQAESIIESIKVK